VDRWSGIEPRLLKIGSHYSRSHLLSKDFHPAPLQYPEQTCIGSTMDINPNNISPPINSISCPRSCSRPTRNLVNRNTLEQHEDPRNDIGTRGNIQRRCLCVGGLGDEAKSDIFMFQERWEPVSGFVETIVGVSWDEVGVGLTSQMMSLPRYATRAPGVPGRDTE